MLERVTNTQTGTEGSTTLFEAAVGKLKVFGKGHDGLQWKMRGKGNFKIVRDPDGRCRFIMNEERTGKLVAHQHIQADDHFAGAAGHSATPFGRERDGKKAANFKWTAVEYMMKDYNDVEAKAKPTEAVFTLMFNKDTYRHVLAG